MELIGSVFVTSKPGPRRRKSASYRISILMVILFAIFHVACVRRGLVCLCVCLTVLLVITSFLNEPPKSAKEQQKFQHPIFLEAF